MYDGILPNLIEKNDTRALLLVADGIGGTTVNGRTELEAAKTPNLDELAAKSSLGLHRPVGYGITPGSGPGHLALFGYDPLKHQIGRGILEALGSGMAVKRGDLAVRGNFATLEKGLITDRRAGRISTDKCRELVAEIRENISDIRGIEFDIKAARDYRFAVVFHDDSLRDNVADADPQQTGHEPVPAKAESDDSEKTAEILNEFIDRVTKLLSGHSPANTCLIRGAARYPDIQTFPERYGMSAQGIAVYPMYRGLASLVGMEVPTGLETLEAEIERLENTLTDHDFHFLHFKYTDSAGEDGDFDRKVEMIEKFDAALPRILSNDFDVVAITGDHSTPSAVKLHSWHPVPLLVSGKFAFADDARRFTEREAANHGIIGHIPGRAIMMLIMANCGRLLKFGA